jgi:hypothetical protein
MVKVFKISFFRRCHYLARYPVWSTLFILLIPSPTAFQQKYPLIFSPSVGDQLIYMLNTSVQAEGKDFSGKDLSLSLTASGSISLDVRRKVGDLVYAGLTSPGIQVEAQTLTGMQRTSLKTNKNAALQAMFDPRGSLHEIHNLKALSNDQFMNVSLVQILHDYFPVLPGKAVTIGESWIDSKHINIPFQEMDIDILIETTYVLQNVIPSAEGDVAVISMDYEVSLSGSKDLGEWTGSFEGKGVGGGLLNFLLQRRCFQEFQADYQTEASLVIKKEGEALTEWPFHLSVLASAIQTNE